MQQTTITDRDEPEKTYNSFDEPASLPVHSSADALKSVQVRSQDTKNIFELQCV
jgi:hypothetical protein